MFCFKNNKWTVATINFKSIQQTFYSVTMLQVTQLGTKDARGNRAEALHWKSTQIRVGNLKILLIKVRRGFNLSQQANKQHKNMPKQFFPPTEKLPFKTKSHFCF